MQFGGFVLVLPMGTDAEKRRTRQAWRICLLGVGFCFTAASVGAGDTSASAFRLVIRVPAGAETAAAPFEQFAAAVEDRVPPPFREAIGGPVTIAFDLDAPLGAAAESPAGGLPQRLNRHTGEECGNFGRIDRSGRRLSLNRAFAAAVQAGPGAAPPLEGFHGNWYDLATATVLHQLAIGFDRNRPGGRLSATRDFQRLIGWRSGLTGGDMRNTNTSRSPCPCEAHSPEAFLAVNLEYYLMDSEYACRRPAEFSFLRQFLPDPFPNRSAKVETRVFLADRYVPVDLSPDIVRAVHYVLATPGKQMESGFGHTQLRLIIQKADAGPAADPMADMGEHVAIGYQAFTLGDLTVDPLGGLFGKYPSLPFVYLFTTVQSRYIAGELRELRSYPLLLTEEERRQLLFILLENYWQYRGAYKFITQNCATETRDDLQACLRPGQPFKRDSSISPGGVGRALRDQGLLDLSPFLDLERARREGYYFPDYDQVQAAFEHLADLYPTLEHRTRLTAYLEKTSGAYRREVYERLVAQAPGDRRVLAAEFYTVECRVRLLASEKVLKAALRLIMRDVKGPLLGLTRWGRPARESVLTSAYREAVALMGVGLPCQLLPPGSGYGIPLAREWPKLPSPEAMEVNRRRLLELRDLVVKSLRNEQGELYGRYADAEENTRFFLMESTRSRPAKP